MMRRSETSNLRWAIALVGLWVLTSTAPLFAEEIHSNGLGGGDWSDPLSWREKKVPTAEDDAVIAPSFAPPFQSAVRHGQ